MKARLPQRRYARGVAALEAALTLGLAAFMVPCLIVLGNVLRQRLVLETVAYQSARQLAVLPRPQMSKSLGYQEAEARIRSQAMAALGGAGIDTSEVTFLADCPRGFCGSASLPQQVQVRLVATVHANAWGPAVGWLIGSQGLELRAVAVLRYEN
jgi:hypothetical protein